MCMSVQDGMHFEFVVALKHHVSGTSKTSTGMEAEGDTQPAVLGTSSASFQLNES